MDGGVVGELGVESRGQNMRFLNQGRFAGEFREYVYVRADTLKNWPANEDHLEWNLFQGGRSADYVAVNLAAVTVAEYGHVQQAQ